MRVLIAPDSSMYRTPDGKYWAPTIYSYDFFTRYLQAFESITVASRVRPASYAEVAGFLRCDGPGMTVAELPDMHGVSGYFRSLAPFLKSASACTAGVDCALIRVPSVPASMVLHFVRRQGLPYALEVVADPEDAYAEKPAAARFFASLLKKQCLEADGVSYVTRDYLQRKYPSWLRAHGRDGRHFESYYSTIRLADGYYGQPRHYRGQAAFTIIHTANNMNNQVKGHEVLLDAARLVLNRGFDVRLRFVGDGALRAQFEARAKQLGLAERTVFTGRLSDPEAVREELLHADMLVFPTRAEGLPRTLIEAMAVGLPCISTPVAGIPELLEPEDLIAPTDVRGFADRICALLSDPARMEEKSRRKIETAGAYSDTLLQERRNAFYRRLRTLAEGSKKT